MRSMEIRRLRRIREGGGYLLGFRRTIAGKSVRGPRSADAPVGSSAGEDTDGGQCDSAISGVWSTHSIASRTCAERRLERGWHRCASVSRWLARSKWNWVEQKNIRGDARTRGGVRGREKVQHHLQASNSTRTVVVQKVFPARNRSGLVARWVRKKGGDGRGGSGIYRGEVFVEEGQGFGGQGRSEGWQCSRARPGLLVGAGRWPDRWAPPVSVGGERKPVPFRDRALLGLGPKSGLG
jgi:hypothetical protein